MAQNSFGNAVSYSSLSRAQLTVEYLHTNSTTHEFLFGALAELVDNARDAGATKMDIFSVPNTNVLGKFLLCFCDDGEGMDPTEVSNVIQFGRSTKRVMDSKMVGQYGNGLKSGSMRIAKDMILFTKKHGTMSCLFLSRTFHEREGIKEVVVPIPSWDVQTKKPFAKSKRELQKHQVELQLILKYSPFHTEAELFEYFDRFKGKGTLVMMYNMKLLDSGETELEPSDDDIKMREMYEDQVDDKSVVSEKKSFRAYSAVLYLDPRMKIYIQGKKVATRKLGDFLYKPKSYYFTSKRFKTRSEREASKAMVDAKSAADKARELETVLKDMQEQYQGISKESRAKLRQAQDSATKARTEADMKNKIAMAKQKSLKEPKTLTFTFGFNINRRHSYGMFVYNCNRLIKMYEKGGFQSDGRRAYAGIVGFVDVPYLVLEPTHNKQDFADAKEYKHLLRSMGDHLSQYWKDSGMKDNNVDKFWDNFGYISNDLDEEPSDEPKYARKRAMQLPYTVQCGECLKWRVLPFSTKNIGRSADDNWVCSLSTDPERNKCSAPEQKSSIPVGYLHKQVKTTEDKQKEIMEEIKRKQEKLGQLNQGRGKPDHWVEKQDDRPVKRVPPRPTTTEPKPAPIIPPTPVAQPAVRPVAQPAVRPAAQPAVRPATQPAVRPATQPAVRPTAQPAVRLAAQPAVRPGGQPAVRPAVRPAAQPAVRPGGQPAVRPGGQPAVRPAAQPAAQPAVRPSAQPAVRPAAQPSPKPAAQPAAQPSPKPAVRPASQPVPKTAGQPTVSLAAQPAPTPTAKPAAKPAAKPTAKLAPIARESSVSETTVNRSSVGSSNKREHPVLEKDICEVQAKRKRNEVTSTQDTQEPEEYHSDNSDIARNDESSSLSKLSKYKVNCKVDVNMSSRWYSGKVVAVKHRKNAPAKVKVKFDHYQKDKYDKWFDDTASNLKLLSEDYPLPHDDTSISSPTSNVPSSTTVLDSPAMDTPTSTEKDTQQQSIDVLSQMLRTCVSYMLVPDFPTTGDQVAKLSLKELKQFPLDKLFVVHSDSIKKIINEKNKNILSNKLSEKERELQEAKRREDDCKRKLSNLRRTAAKLIRSLNENPEESSVACNDDTERVDVLLEAIAEQASSGDAT